MPEQNSIKPLSNYFVDKQTVKDRIDNYRNIKHALLRLPNGGDDTKHIWYSIEHIEDICAEMRYLGADGLRIYLGAYPDGHAFSNQTCLLMVPTKGEDTGERHIDIILEDLPDFEERAILQSKAAVIDKQGTYNYGSPCPPRCPKPTDGLEEEAKFSY